MTTTERSANRVFQGWLTITVALTLAPFTASAMPRFEPAQIVDQPAVGRVVVTLIPIDTIAGSTTIAATTRSIGTRVDHAATIHGFRVSRLDAESRSERRIAPWSVSVFSGAAGAGSEGLEQMATLSTDASELRVPRPYGIRVEAGDSLSVIATVDASDAGEPMVLQLIIDYESPDGPVSRLPVLALSSSDVQASQASASSARRALTEDAWIWRPAVSGRLVAISGHQLAGAEALVLEDAVTGVVLWSTRAQGPVSRGTTNQQGDVIRPSVPVVAGRSYRLRAVYDNANGSPSPRGSGVLLAMLFPVQ